MKLFYGENRVNIDEKMYSLIRDEDLGVWYIRSDVTGLCSGVYLNVSSLVDDLKNDRIEWVFEECVTQVLDDVKYGEAIKVSNVCA